MEKDIGKIQKNENADIVVRVDDYGGHPGVTIREFITTERYTGFTKQGTRIPAAKFLEFREMINSISLDDLKPTEKSEEEESPGENPEQETLKTEEVEDY